MTPVVLAAVIALLAVAGCPATAQDSDTETIEACIGVLSQPCLDDSRNNSTAGMVACLDREAKAWDGLLNDYDKRLTDKLDDKQRTTLRELQRAWIAYRDKACAFHNVFHQGTNA